MIVKMSQIILSLITYVALDGELINSDVIIKYIKSLLIYFSSVVNVHHISVDDVILCEWRHVYVYDVITEKFEITVWGWFGDSANEW